MSRATLNPSYAPSCSCSKGSRLARRKRKAEPRPSPLGRLAEEARTSSVALFATNEYAERWRRRCLKSEPEKPANLKHYASARDVVADLQPDYPVYCVRPHAIRVPARTFVEKFPGPHPLCSEVQPHAAHAPGAPRRRDQPLRYGLDRGDRPGFSSTSQGTLLFHASGQGQNGDPRRPSKVWRSPLCHRP